MVSMASKKQQQAQSEHYSKQSRLQVAAHAHMVDDDDDYGEGEVEDTQIVNNNGLAAAQQIKTPMHQKSGSLALKQNRQSDGKSSRSRASRRSNNRERSSSRQRPLPPFQSIYNKKMIESFPQRTRWEIPESKIVFSSQFCSGNMTRAQRGFQKNNFDIWVSGDAMPHMGEDQYYKTWFYFSVTGVPQGELLTFTFKNLSNQTKLYNQGLKPAFRVMPTQQKKWRRIMTKVTTFFNNDDQFILQFSHMFAYPESQTTYFAFTFPFSYQDSIELTEQIQHKLTNQPNVYFNREILYYSLEGRPMELLTISSREQITEEHETIPEDGRGLFPAAERNPRSRSLRFKKEKPVIFMTSRVHPGETPGSHVLNGFLEMLCDLRSDQGRCLRKNFVFKVIMILNPDGVSRGFYRLDTMACNLNRLYLNPSKDDHPTIWATRHAVVQQAEQYKCLKMFIDFHAHASKRGGFMFGNHITDAEKQADNITFTKLIAMNCLNFDMNECNFSDKIMAIKDRNGQSREGSSRVALSKATGLIYCYTLEFNYHSGRRINTLAPKYVRATGSIEPETEMTDPQSRIYANQASPPFSQEIFEDCGHAVGAALLDLVDDNPISRIPLSCYRTVTNVRTDILKNIGKYETGNVNVVGANHFAPTNTKVAKAFANTPGPRIKLNGSAGHHSKAEQEKLKKAASLLTAPTKPKHGTFGVTKRLLDDNVTNTTASTKAAARNGDTSVPKEKKNSASVRNPAGGKSRYTGSCNSASQQPVQRNNGKLNNPGSAKQSAKGAKQQIHGTAALCSGQWAQQTQMGLDTNVLNGYSFTGKDGQRLTEQQLVQLHQYHLSLQAAGQQQLQINQSNSTVHQAAAFGNQLDLGQQPLSSTKQQPPFVMSQVQQQQYNYALPPATMSTTTTMNNSKEIGQRMLLQQHQQMAQIGKMNMSVQQPQYQTAALSQHQQHQLQLQQQVGQEHHRAQAHQMQLQQQHMQQQLLAQQKALMMQRQQPAASLQDQQLQISPDKKNRVSKENDSNQLSLPCPNPHYAQAAQHNQVMQKRAQSHARTELAAITQDTHQSNGQVSRPMISHYSPIPKIQQQSIDHEHQLYQVVQKGSMSLHHHSEEKGVGATVLQRSSSRQYRGSHADKSSIDPHHQRNDHHLDAIDPYDRKSMDSKGQQAKLIKTATQHPKHAHHSGMTKVGISGSHQTQQHLEHGRGGDLSTGNHDTDQHHLPTISPNYTTSAMNSKDSNTQSSSRTLSTVIPQIHPNHHQSGILSPSMQHQHHQQTEFINHRGLKAKNPMRSGLLQHQQLQMMSHNRNAHSKASLHQFAPKSSQEASMHRTEQQPHKTIVESSFSQTKQAPPMAGGKPPKIDRQNVFKTGNASQNVHQYVDSETGVIVTHINAATSGTPTGKIQHRNNKDQDLFMNERPSKKQSSQTKKSGAKGGQKSHLISNQSMEGGLKAGSATGSVGQKKPSRLQQSKTQSNHSHKEKINQ